MAAVLASGTTRSTTPPSEPEIVDIAEMLVSMGARIEGAGTSPHRGPRRRGARADRARRRARPHRGRHLGLRRRDDPRRHRGRRRRRRAPASAARRARAAPAADVEVTTRGFRVVGRSSGRPRAFDVATLPYPGFPTDLQPFALTYNAVADGSAMITENLFEARFRTVQELARLGADARIDGHHVMVHGVPLALGCAGRGQRHPRRRGARHRRSRRRRRHHGQRRPPRRPRLPAVRAGAAGPRRRRHPRARRRAPRFESVSRHRHRPVRRCGASSALSGVVPRSATPSVAGSSLEIVFS